MSEDEEQRKLLTAAYSLAYRDAPKGVKSEEYVAFLLNNKPHEEILVEAFGDQGEPVSPATPAKPLLIPASPPVVAVQRSGETPNAQFKKLLDQKLAGCKKNGVIVDPTEAMVELMTVAHEIRDDPRNPDKRFMGEERVVLDTLPDGALVFEDWKGVHSQGAGATVGAALV